MRGGFKSWVRFLFALCATALLLSSCHKLVGKDFKTDVDSQAGGPGDLSGECRPGTWKCNREFLLECTPARTWKINKTCATANQCDPLAKACTVCPQAGQRRCNGAVREVCAVDRSRWEAQETCLDASQCNTTHCGPCAPGELQCVGELTQELQVCNADYRWQSLGMCETAPLCASSVAKGMDDPSWTPMCLPPVCDAGALSCDGSSLSVCRQGREAQDRVEICASAALCEQAAAKGATGQISCAPVCAPGGSFRCTGQNLEQCSSDQTEWIALTTCDATRTCDSTMGQCGPPCDPLTDSYRCNVERLERCMDGAWVLENTCVTAALCSKEEQKCKPPTCLPGDLQCNPDDPRVLERCSVDQDDFDPVATCLSGVLCGCALSGTCKGGFEDSGCGRPVCMPDPTSGTFPLRCNPTSPLNVEQCASTLNDWEYYANCEAGEFCFTQDRESPCKIDCPAPKLCNGSQLLNCTPEGPVHQANCATPTLCQCAIDGTCTSLNPNGCGNPVCGGTLPSYQCAGAVLQTCQVGRNGWDSTPCGNPALCFAGGVGVAGYCAVCPVAGEISCTPDDTGVRTCSPDRKGYVQQMTCGLGCIERAGASADYCPVCSPNELRCSGSTPGSRVRQCNADQTALTDVGGVCASGCLDVGLTDVCAACEANEVRCSGLQLMACNSARTALTPMGAPCTQSCIDSGLADYCGACVVGSRQCNTGNTRLLTCAGTGAFDTGVACPFGCLVKAGDDACAPTCTPGTYRCASTTGGAGDRLEVCNANGDGWTLEEACGAGLCDAAGSECNDCTAGQFSCSAGTLRDCDANGQWRNAVNNCEGNSAVRTCNGNTLVQTACGVGQTCDETANECDDCSGTSTFSCSAGTLRQCDGTGHWVSTGSTNCAGTTLRTCGGAGNNTVSTNICTICDDTANQCDICTPGSYRCVSGDLEVCNSTGQMWDAADACIGSTLRTCTGAGGNTVTPTACMAPASSCNAAGTACGVCVEGSERCQSMGSNVLQTCSGGVWVASPDSPCANGCVGAEPTAACATCTTGATRCDDDQPQSCMAGVWTDTGMACTGGTPVCLNATCVQCTTGQTAACTGATPVCVGNTCRECTTNAHCTDTPATPLCLTSTNTCVACMAPAADCGGPDGEPRQCVSGAWVVGDACSGQTPMCTGGTCVCTTGSARCMTGQRQVCTAGTWTPSACTGETPVCTGSGVCAACTTNTQCAPNVCDTVSGACVQCVDETDCAMDQVCDTMNECVAAGP